MNLLFYEDYFTADLNTGHVFSLVYDRMEGALVHTEDALALAGLNEKGLLDQVTEQVQTQIDRDYQEYDFQLALHNLILEGFRIKANGQPVFYPTGRVDDVDDAISGADHLYIWEDRAVTTYDQYGVEPVPLVPAEETEKWWNQWYFAGEEPEGALSAGTSPGRTPTVRFIMGAAFSLRPSWINTTRILRSGTSSMPSIRRVRRRTATCGSVRLFTWGRSPGGRTPTPPCMMCTTLLPQHSLRRLGVGVRLGSEPGDACPVPQCRRW